ncbi:RNA polymerase sigma factor [Mucilaginibacter sp. AW1-3]
MNKPFTDTVLKAQRGNQDAMFQLYEQYKKAMFNICIRMTANRDDAEDVLQESFMMTFKNLEQLKEPERFAGWLKRIVVNECIRFCKSKIPTNEWNEADHEHMAEDETEWWIDVKLNDIHNAIKTLPDGCRLVFSLYALEDYSHKQIAENLNISEGTSKSQYHRAKTLLKQVIIKQLQNDGQV